MSETTDAPVRIGVASHVGGRDHNEDSYVIVEPPDPRVLAARGRLVVVADGMGGALGGETASKLVVETISREYYAHGEGSAVEALRIAVERANATVHQHAAGRPDLRGMGSTVVAVALHQGLAWYAHVGDSRLYLMRQHQLYQLTTDHTRVNKMVQDGFLTADQARVHPERNVLNRSMGPGPSVQVEVCPEPVHLEDGDRLLLCSDGLTDTTHESELAWFLDHHPDPQQAAEALVGFVMDRYEDGLARGERQKGGQDNATLQVVLVGDPPAATAGARPSPGRAAPATMIRQVPILTKPTASWRQSRLTIGLLGGAALLTIALVAVLLLTDRKGSKHDADEDDRADQEETTGDGTETAGETPAPATPGDQAGVVPDSARPTPAPEPVKACFGPAHCEEAMVALFARVGQEGLGAPEVRKAMRTREKGALRELQEALKTYQIAQGLKAQDGCPNNETLAHAAVNLTCPEKPAPVDDREPVGPAPRPVVKGLEVGCLRTLYERNQPCRRSVYGIMQRLYALEKGSWSGEEIQRRMDSHAKGGWRAAGASTDLLRMMSDIYHFQVERQMKADGCPGPRTAEALNARWSCPHPVGGGAVILLSPRGGRQIKAHVGSFAVDQDQRGRVENHVQAVGACEKRGMRLPTEAEWKRAQTTLGTKFAVGGPEWLQDAYLKPNAIKPTPSGKDPYRGDRKCEKGRSCCRLTIGPATGAGEFTRRCLSVGKGQAAYRCVLEWRGPQGH